MFTPGNALLLLPEIHIELQQSECQQVIQQILYLPVEWLCAFFCWKMPGAKVISCYLRIAWESQSNDQAAVHCVIVGFSCAPGDKVKKLYQGGQVAHVVKNVNAYLLDSPDIFVLNRSKGQA